jgi:hypothetical protein
MDAQVDRSEVAVGFDTQVQAAHGFIHSGSFMQADDEGRTLVQNLLASAADLEVTPEELRVKVSHPEVEI